MDTRSTTAESRPDKPEELIGLIDCGRASERTKGWPNQVLFEFGAPPFNTMPG